MKVLYIETFTRAMKKKGITQGKGELDDYSLTIDLDNLFIVMGKESFELAKIPGTKGGYRYFFLCPDCGRRCRKLFKIYNIFACGSCQKIHQATLNRSKTDCQYYWRLAFKECLKVNPKARHKHGYYSHDDFPKRPKYMRIAKYLYHWKRFHYYMDKGDRHWL
ncbi:TPA: hypothetical protein ACGNJJ_000857 [Streptococcus agalactiae]